MMEDIDEKILIALKTIFALELQQKVVGDPLALITLKQAELQDDPTITAPYVVFKNAGGDEEGMRLLKHGHEQHMYGCSEIGGPLRYLYFFQCTYGTPLATSRDKARADTSALRNRIIKTLITYADLANILAPGALQSDDQAKFIEGQNDALVTHGGYHIYGGETTFYGKGMLFWQYPVSWLIHTRSYY